MSSIVLPDALRVHRRHPGKHQQHLHRGGPNTGRCSLWSKVTKLQDASNRLAQKRNRRLRVVNAVPDGRISEQKKCKRVSFKVDANQVHLFVTLVDPTTHESIPAVELWRSREEIQSGLCTGKLEALLKESAQAYCRAYERAHRQVHISRKLTATNLCDLVKGLALGHRGLELHSAFTAQRKKAIRHHVSSVIAFHRDNKSGSVSLGLDDSSHCSCSSSHSSSTFNSNSTTGRVHLERTVRYYSAKLSAGDRHFAFALGKAHFMAATCANDENTVNAIMA
jgi:hypothetical protein